MAVMKNRTHTHTHLHDTVSESTCDLFFFRYSKWSQVSSGILHDFCALRFIDQWFLVAFHLAQKKTIQNQKSIAPIGWNNGRQKTTATMIALEQSNQINSMLCRSWSMSYPKRHFCSTKRFNVSLKLHWYIRSRCKFNLPVVYLTNSKWVNNCAHIAYLMNK